MLKIKRIASHWKENYSSQKMREKNQKGEIMDELLIRKMYIFCKKLRKWFNRKDNMLNLSLQKIQAKQYLKQLQSDGILNCCVKLEG